MSGILFFIFASCHPLNTPRTLLICESACLTMHATVGQKCFLCHSIEISISLERLYQSSPFFHHCKGKFMTNLEIDIICSRFFLFLRYSSHPMIAFFMTHPVYICMFIYIFNIIFVIWRCRTKSNQINPSTIL